MRGADDEDVFDGVVGVGVDAADCVVGEDMAVEVVEVEVVEVNDKERFGRVGGVGEAAPADVAIFPWVGGGVKYPEDFASRRGFAGALQEGPLFLTQVQTALSRF